MPHVVEAFFADLADLFREVIDTQAFLQRRSDAEPFLQGLPEIYGAHPDCHCFALRSDEQQQLGFVVVLPHEPEEEGTLDIGPTYIRPEYRGKGYGKLMLGAVIHWADARGARRLCTATWGRNVAARRVFTELGFRYVGEEADTRVDGDSTILYER